MFLSEAFGDRDHARPALITADQRTITYPRLRQLIGETGRLLESDRKLLVAIWGERDLATVLAYLGALAHGQACALHDATAAAGRQHQQIDAYQPDLVVYSPAATTAAATERADYVLAGEMPDGGTVFRRVPPAAGEVFAETALLLTTSGSTGSPQMVRLSRTNLVANAGAIAAALGIAPSDRAITSLPLHYCYGLSVLNSHLFAGGSVVLASESPVSRTFWRRMATCEVTHVAAVPTVYRLLHRSGIDPASVFSLRMMTQAGARLEDDLIRHYAGVLERRGGQFVVMYGQTEATARIACLPHDDLPHHPGSVGRAVPGGRLWIRPDGPGGGEGELPDGAEGRVMYAGPNVMLGYARSRADLARGDTRNGVLDTGDRGLLRDGVLYLTGRVKRVVKVHGIRIALDDVERAVGGSGPAAAVSTSDERIVLFTADDPVPVASLCDQLARELRLPRRVFEVTTVPAIPTTHSGKADYPQLQKLAGERHAHR